MEMITRLLPVRLLISMAVSIFAVEVAVMFLLSVLPSYSTPVHALFDATVLVVIIFPILYFLSFRPLVLHIRQQMRVEEELRKSEEKYRNLVENINDVVFEMDTNGRITYVSPVIEQLSGYSPAEVTGRSFTEFVHSDDLQFIADSFRRGLAGKPEPSEYRILSKSGEVLWIRSFGRLLSKGGRIVAYRTVLADITDRKRAEEALLVSEERFRSLIASSQAGIVAYGTDFRITMWSPAMEQITGVRSENVLGRTAFEAFPFLEEVEEGNAVREAVMGKASILSEMPYDIPQAGKSGYFESSHFPLRDTQGKVIGGMGVIHDITERKRAEDALRESEEYFRSLVENTSDVITILDGDGTMLYVGPSVQQVLGYKPENLIGKSGFDFVHPDDSPDAAIVLSQALQDPGTYQSVEFRFRHADGSWIPLDVVGKTVLHGSEPAHVVVNARDITDRKRAEEVLRGSEEKFRTLVESASEGIIIVDGAGRIVLVNAMAEEVFGYDRGEMLGQTVELLVPERLREAHVRYRAAYLANTGVLPMGGDRNRFGRRKDGSEFPMECSRTVIETQDGLLVMSFIRDVTDRKRAEETIRRLAYHDALTGLPNWALFKDRLSLAMAEARRRKQAVAVLFLDLDNFKDVNDMCGHVEGDKVLRSFGERLSNLVREADTVARMGGDEFIILLSDITGAIDVTEVAGRVLEGSRRPWMLNGSEFHLTASIGIALYPNDGEDTEVVLRNADTAMYRAKDSGGDSYKYYSQSMHAEIEERLAMEAALRHALEREEFVVHYQPQVDIASGRIVGVEALVRWQHPERGLVAPAEFIPVAEETGLIVPLGEWVLRTACAQSKAWEEAGVPPIRVAVNVSARQLQQGNLEDTVTKVLKVAGLPARRLQLEVTEGMAMEDAGHDITRLGDLVAMGVEIAIDDFGTGYSSLGHLRSLPIHVLKIDRSFVRDLTDDLRDAEIAATIIGLAHSLHLKVIAEGVETEEQLAFLKEHKCDEFQGFLFSKPVPADEALDQVLRQRGRARASTLGRSRG